MDKKGIIEQLRALGMTNYGSVIEGDLVRKWAGIEYPETGTKEEFDNLALQELSVIDYIRNCLLNEGKYLKAHRDDYRILSPSENSGQVEAYMRSADQKLKRAIKLSKNTPVQSGQSNNSFTARAMLKRESIKEQRRKDSVTR
jgi:hypothetical protein